MLKVFNYYINHKREPIFINSTKTSQKVEVVINPSKVFTVAMVYAQARLADGAQAGLIGWPLWCVKLRPVRASHGDTTDKVTCDRRYL